MAAAAGPPENGSTTEPHSPASNLPSETPDPSLTATGTTADAIANPTPPPMTEVPAPEPAEEKWPGWPGHCVFRLVVPVAKVGSIIGRKGELIKKLCEETRARVRVLDGAVGTPDRVVLVSGKEELEAPLSPAMDASMRIFKCVNGLPENLPEGDSSGAAFCSIRLLVPHVQAIHLIGKQGSLIKSIQESSDASVRVLPGDETLSSAAPDERIVELHGEAFKVAKALESVIGQLRKFLVDHTVLPLFEKTHSTVTQGHHVEAYADKSQTGSFTEYPFSFQREPLFLDRESQLESRIAPPLSVYSQESGISSLRSIGLGRTGGPIVTQVAQTMQIPMAYAEDIIGTAGTNIAFIRQNSGATITVQESRGYPDEITVEIKGTASEVQAAQQLIQEFINNHKERFSSSYDQVDAGYRSMYGQLSNSTSYPPSSLPPQPYGGYSGSGAGGHSSFRL